MNKELLGRVLGPFKNEGNEMAQAILTAQGTIVPRRTVRPLSKSELISDVEKQKREVFDRCIQSKLGHNASEKPPSTANKDYVPYSDGNLDPPNLEDIEEDPVDNDGLSMFEKPVTDHLIHAEVVMPKGENNLLAKVIGRSKAEDGNTIGTYDENLMLNTLVHDVQFPDGTVKEYSANVIAENLYSQVDSNGHSHTLLESILDYKKDKSAVDKADLYVTTKSGRRRMRKSTAGWKLLVLWRDGSEEWIPLSIVKESNPVG